MFKIKITIYRFILCFIIAYGVSGCYQTDLGLMSNKNFIADFNRLTEKAQRNLNLHPDSALLYADSASRLPGSFINKGGRLFIIGKIQFEALNNLQLTDSAYAVIEQTWLLANQYSDTLSRAYAAEKLGILNLNQNKFILAEKFLTEASALYREMGLIYLKAKAESKLGSVFYARGNYAASQQYLFETYHFFKQVDSIRDLSKVCLNIGNNYSDQGNSSKAREYYDMAFKIAPPGDHTRIGALLNIGIMYKSTFPDSALLFYRKAASLIDQYGNIQEKVKLQYNIANIYVEQKKLMLALANFRKVLALCRENTFLSGVARAYYGISVTQIMMNNPDSAIYYGELALKTAALTGETRLEINAIDALADYHKTKGNLSKVVELYQRARSMNDSINTIGNKSVTGEMELLETVRRKEMESDQLRMKLIENQTRFRNHILLIAVLVVFVLLLVILLRRSVRLNRERLNAYSVLMDKYIAERNVQKLKTESLTSIEPEPMDSSASVEPLLETLIRYYETEKPYLDPKLKLETVVERLHTNSRALSQSLKAFNNANFNTFTNYFRVEEAKSMMEDPKFRNYKIEAIALEAGFGTKMTFYNTFESQTGIKPSYYRESITKA